MEQTSTKHELLRHVDHEEPSQSEKNKKNFQVCSAPNRTPHKREGSTCGYRSTLSNGHQPGNGDTNPGKTRENNACQAPSLGKRRWLNALIPHAQTAAGEKLPPMAVALASAETNQPYKSQLELRCRLEDVAGRLEGFPHGGRDDVTPRYIAAATKA